MITSLGQREVFHLAFLRLLNQRLRPNSYAIKGGVNLRLFFGSVRYSEDMDIDIKGVEVFKLKESVMDILASKTLLIGLRSFQIEKIVPPDISAAKQTETTQRFKVHLISHAGEDLFTKIEFSRRKFEAEVVTEAVNDDILRRYMLPPLIVPHYPASIAILQKVRALAERSETQGRDIFDLHLLTLRSSGDGALLKSLPKTTLKKAYDNIFVIDFNAFRDTVLNYLSSEDRKIYDRKDVWEDIQLKVGELLK